MTQQFTGIQLLRFTAAMLVVGMHISQAISIHTTGPGSEQYWHGGAAGVNIFFVVSGFVMALSSRAATGDAPSRWRAVWILMRGRLLRIVPQYWFNTLLKVALLLAVSTLAVTSSIEDGHLAASLSFLVLVSPWGLVQSILPVGWTLNFEILFYLVFALAVASGAPRIRFCLLVFLLIFLSAHFFPLVRTLAFYGQAIVFELVLGALIAAVLLRSPAPPAVVSVISILAGLVLVFSIQWPADAVRLGTMGLGAATIVMGTVWLEAAIIKNRFAAQFSFAGDASYSIYFSHTFVVPAGALALWQLGVQDCVAVLLRACGAVVATGFASCCWLEKPMTLYLKRILFRVPPPRYRNAEVVCAN